MDQDSKAIVEARKMAREVAEATKSWAGDAARLGTGKAEIETMGSAFDHGDLRQALTGKGVQQASAYSEQAWRQINPTSFRVRA